MEHNSTSGLQADEYCPDPDHPISNSGGGSTIGWKQAHHQGGWECDGPDATTPSDCWNTSLHGPVGEHDCDNGCVEGGSTYTPIKDGKWHHHCSGTSIVAYGLPDKPEGE
jgi:hypothetical protein